MRLSERVTNIIVGLVALTLAGGLTTVGVKFAFGEFDDTYGLVGDFGAAGQGLLGGADGSDVKIRGVNIGHVDRIELVDGIARVTLAIDSGQRVPTTARAVIRPKTLFGEKFVDIVPGEGEGTGPWLEPGGEIAETLGGFELERVLTEAYPILLAIDPAELGTILATLADGGEGLGPAVNRQLVDARAVTEVMARRDADLRRFLADFAEVVDELALRAGDVVGGARDLNLVLPELNTRAGSFATLLDGVARLSGDLADLFEANRGFLDAATDEGTESLRVLFEERARIGPLVDGLGRYLRTVAEAAHIPLGDGTMLAAVKSIEGGEPCGRGRGGCLSATEPDAAAPVGPEQLLPRLGLPLPLPVPLPVVPVVPAPQLPGAEATQPFPVPSTGAQAVIDLIGGSLR